MPRDDLQTSICTGDQPHLPPPTRQTENKSWVLPDQSSTCPLLSRAKHVTWNATEINTYRPVSLGPLWKCSMEPMTYHLTLYIKDRILYQQNRVVKTKRYWTPLQSCCGPMPRLHTSNTAALHSPRKSKLYPCAWGLTSNFFNILCGSSQNKYKLTMHCDYQYCLQWKTEVTGRTKLESETLNWAPAGVTCCAKSCER